MAENNYIDRVEVDGTVYLVKDAEISASATTPKAAGTAAAGTETAYARGDHVHPKEVSDADRAAWDGKQDTSTAITTANIANQNVNKAKYATDDVAVGIPGLRNEKFVSTETTPTVNGQICWTYG